MPGDRGPSQAVGSPAAGGALDLLAALARDTPTGVGSAEAAGCAVPSLAAIEPAPGRTVLAGLTEVTPDRLRGMTRA
ncbi:hypothetical protein ACIGEZ_13065 [Streptomyces sp. NPDC085481]|uniref:hypothetical protein n=1 Tax=Streptomyces sp. NPDC085481 TaxID=3365727 RepID=UPI0037D3FCCF